LKAFEIKWGLTRDDSLWLASAFFTLATDKVAAKAVGGASSALNAVRAARVRTPKIADLCINRIKHSTISELRALNIKIAAENALKGFKFEVHHIVPVKFLDHEVFKLAGTHLNDRMNLIPLPTHATEKILGTGFAIHSGRHDDKYNKLVYNALKKIAETGKAHNWTQKQYQQKLHGFMDHLGEGLLRGMEHVNKAGERYHHAIHNK
ncbi:MAG: AHH domain-containing protein, partial [Alphaproteobacteria bacterium]|nr:AHH domain-containing protein [Alphaproteobacteria bacterium]